MKSVDITWVGGEHSFKLTIEHMRAIQQLCDAGPGLVHTRLLTGAWHVDDVIQPIRLGLEGGGMDKEDAKKLLVKHVETGVFANLVETSVALLGLFIWGAEPDDEPGELSGEAEPEDAHSQERKSDSVKSTNSEPSVGSSQEPLIE